MSATATNVVCFLAGALTLHLGTALWCWCEERRKLRQRLKRPKTHPHP
jgi:hypothetical protein